MPITYDPLLADKIFDIETYKEQEQIQKENIDTRIKTEIYGNSQHNPIYYQGEKNPTSLNFFLNSPEFNNFKRELVTIKQQLDGWLDEHPINIEEEIFNNQNGVEESTIILVPAQEILAAFFHRLVNDDYADFRAHLYAEGKKYLETIVVLVKDESIGMTVRKAAVINLLNDGGLGRGICAAGCQTRLAAAAEYLSNVNKQSLESWTHDYLFGAVEEIAASRADSSKSYTESLCDAAQIDVGNGQIHARNYLLTYAVENGRLPLKIPEDNLLTHFRDNADCNAIANRYLTTLSKKINAQGLSVYIADKLHDLAKTEISNFEAVELGEIDKIQADWDALGSDEFFHPVDIISDEGALRASNHFQITAMERLLNKEWFNSDKLSSGVSEEMRYKLFTDNIPLSWIKKPGEGREQLSNLAKTPESLEDLHTFWNVFLRSEGYVPRANPPELSLPSELLEHYRLATKVFKGLLVDMQLKEFKGWNLQPVNFREIDNEYLNWNPELTPRERMFKKAYQIPIESSKLFMGIDFSEANLQNNDLSFLDLSESKFIKANLQEVNFRNTRLKLADLSGANLNQANIEGVNFEGADLSAAKLVKIKATAETSFKKAKLKNADLNYAELAGADFTDVNFEGADLRHANFEDATLSNANLESADLRHANFEAAILTNIKLNNAKLYKAILQGVDLENTDLQGINLESVHLQEARLKGANLKNAILRNADLNHAELVNADLTGADLRDANLRNANLQNAILQDANFLDADMRGILGQYDLRGPKRKLEEGNDHEAPLNKRPAIAGQMDIQEPILSLATSLEAATFLRKDYEYALQKHDIEAIGKTFYFNEPHLFFEAIDSPTELTAGLDRFKSSEFSDRGRGVFIVNLGSGHWVTLMIFGPEALEAGARAPKLNIYYIDSLGEPISPAIDELLKGYGSIGRFSGTNVQQLLEGNPQTSDAYNSALWSMENAEIFDNVLQDMELAEDLPRNDLLDEWKYKLLDYPMEQELLKAGKKMGKVYFEEKRRNFSKNLLKDATRLENYEQQIDAESAEEASASMSCMSIRPGTSRQKREAMEECSISEEDIEKITVKKATEPVNNEKIVDSTTFLEFLGSCNDAKRTQLLKWVAAPEISITGYEKDQAKVQRLIRIESIKPPLKLVSKISSGLMQGKMGVDSLIAMFKYDGNATAINVGFMGASHGLGKLSELAAVKGEKLIAEGENLLGKSLKMTTPFLSRATSLFMAYDLFNQAKANNTEGVIFDSLMLGSDIFAAGIEVVEMAGLEILAGISSVVGPLSAGFDAIVMVIMQIVSAVKIVARLDDLLHLTGWEKFKEGLLGAAGMSPEEYLEKLADLKQRYQISLEKILKMLQGQSSIKRYVNAASNATIVCRDVETTRLTVKFFGQGDKSWPKPTKEVCETLFSFVGLSFVDFTEKRYWSELSPKREIPQSPVGSEFICIPSGASKTLTKSMDAYLCNGAMSISDTAKTEGATLFDFADGQRTAFGYLDEPNIFIVRNGFMYFTGGKKKDLFILQGNSVRGVLSGGEDEDTLDLSKFFPPEKPMIDLREEELECRDNSISIRGIENFIGRNSLPESFIAGCDTRILNTQGGTTTDKDSISIAQDANCDYALKMPLHPNTMVHNQATRGNFSYIILPGAGETGVNLPSLGQAHHQFMFNSTVADLLSISFQPSDQAVGIPVRHTASFHFADFVFNVSSIAANTSSFYFQDGAELKIGDKQNSYIFYNDIKSSIDNIIDIYSPIANRLNMTFFLSTLGNQFITIGHGEHEVMQNDPTTHETHLVGNGGENLFAINYGRSSNVILYQRSDNDFTDTLYLGAYTRQIRSQFDTTTIMRLIPPTKHNKLGDDVMLLLTSGYQETTIRFKHAGSNRWHENLQILDVAPQKIVGPLTNLRLEPVPLEFTVHNRVIGIGPNDVEKNTRIIIPRIFDDYSFFRDGDNLIVTDALDEYALKINRHTFILLYNFYSTPKLASLTIQLPNRNIVLKHKLAQINAAADIKLSWSKYINDFYELAFNHTGLHEINRTNVSMEMSPSNISLIQDFVSGERETNASETGNTHRHRHRHGSHSRYTRAIGTSEQKPIASGAVRSSGILQTFVGCMTHAFFADKKQKALLTVASNEVVLFRTRNTCDKNAAPKPKQCFKTTALSTKVIIAPSKWRQPLTELGTGIIAGGMGEIFDNLIEFYPNRLISFTMLRTFLDAMIMSSRYFLSSSANELELEDTLSPFMTVFLSNLFITASLQSLLIGLEAIDRSLCKQVKRGIQALYNFFFLQAMFNFFTSDESGENKLTTLLNWTCYAGANMGAHKATRMVMNTHFFNLDPAKKEESDSRPPVMSCSSPR